jgi:2-hydroxy-6-oxo-6-(2'-carboxyphenyl)-hexa-2,4-dienoate hydrolase
MKNPGFIDVEGIRTRYFQAGSGPALVLIHGGQFGHYYNACHWSLNFDDLASDFRVYAVDRLGQGYTDNPKTAADYTMTRAIGHVEGFLRAAAIDSAVLLGHSRGALVAARIACDHPARVKALVIVSSNSVAADHPSTPTDFYAKLDDNAPAEPDAAFVRREPEANSYSGAHISADFVEEMLGIARLVKTREARRTMAAVLTTQFLPDVRKVKYETLDMIRDGRLRAPTLVLWGLNDRSAPVVIGHQLFEHIANAVPRSEMHVFNHAGHYVFRERHLELDEVVTQFVKRLAS